MLNSEEKIKEFLKDEEKVKTLANDTEFVNKVSSGQAAVEVYVEEFKKFGIEISNKEATKIKDVVESIVKVSPEKIEEKALEVVSGGTRVAETVKDTGLIVGAASGVVSAGLLISGIICDHVGVSRSKCELLLKLSGASALIGASAMASALVGSSIASKSKSK